MKKYLLILLVSFGAEASNPTFFFQERTQSANKICEVFESKVRIILTKAKKTKVTEKAIIFDPAWSGMIKVASKGQLEKFSVPRDEGYKVFKTGMTTLSSIDDEGNSVVNLSNSTEALIKTIFDLCQ